MKQTVRKLKSWKGFTMIEVISVLLIIGIIALVTVVRMNNLSNYSLPSEVDVVKAHLRMAQLRAMSSGNVCGVNFSGNSYTLFIGGNTSNVRRFPDQNTAGNVTLPSSMSITTGSTTIISFDAWGRPCTDAAGSSFQSGNRTLTVSCGSNTSNITITQNTGFIP